MYFLYISLLLILFPIITNANRTIISIRILDRTSIMPGDRDGVLIATLNSNEETTICNYNFNQVDAAVACKTLGYPAKGYAIISNNPTPPPFSTYPVLLGDFNCSGAESMFMLCVNSGRKIYEGDCGAHKMDVHIYCLEPKVDPTVTTVTKCTSVNKNNNVTMTSLDGLKNSGILQLNGAYVCDNDFNLDKKVADVYCAELCGNTAANPSLLYSLKSNYIVGNNAVTLSCPTSSQCNVVQIITNCPKSSIIGIKCGNEPDDVENSPEVTCNNTLMIVRWVGVNSTDKLNFINESAVTVRDNCIFTFINTTSTVYSLGLSIALNITTMTSDSKYIYYSCFINRKYYFDPPTTKSLKVQCLLPRNNTDNQTVNFQTASPLALENRFNISTKMTFYTDNTYSIDIKNVNDYSIDSDKNIYVKVTLENSPVDTFLVLKRCVFNDQPKLNDTADLLLIQNSCPLYTPHKVQITNRRQKEVTFEFSALLVSGKFKAIYVICESQTCYRTNDSNCNQCTNRRKRSAFLLKNGPLVIGRLR